MFFFFSHTRRGTYACSRPARNSREVVADIVLVLRAYVYVRIVYYVEL